jgi:7-keto-8-aminopelargonate synthetase-like enzyme
MPYKERKIATIKAVCQELGVYDCEQVHYLLNDPHETRKGVASILRAADWSRPIRTETVRDGTSITRYRKLTVYEFSGGKP